MAIALLSVSEGVCETDSFSHDEMTRTIEEGYRHVQERMEEQQP